MAGFSEIDKRYVEVLKRHVVGRIFSKRIRKVVNGRKMTISKSCIFFNQTDFIKLKTVLEEAALTMLLEPFYWIQCQVPETKIS